MSDNEDNQPEYSIFFMSLPPEIRDHLERQKMEMSQNAHEGAEFFDSLSEEQLRTLRGLLGSMKQDEDVILYFMGLVSALLHSKFDVCLACSKKHDEELSHMAGMPAQTEADETEEESLDSNKVLEFMAEYNLTSDGNKLYCSECGRRYPSLEDRMLSKPGKEGCPTCVHQEKWG